MKKESQFEKECLKKLKKLPYSYWPPKGESGSTHGVPDRIGCVRGKYIALEFKRSLAEALKYSDRKPLQEYTVAQVQEAGGFGAFVYPENWDLIYRQIRELSE